MSLTSKQYLELQIQVFNERLMELTKQHGRNSEEVVRFSKRLDELNVRYRNILD